MATTNTTPLKFKWGQVKNNEKFTNPSHADYKIDNGSVYVATDERSIYVDYDGKRIRLGDFLEYATLDELKQDYASWNTSTLAYIATGDMLVKYDETKGWIQLNDTSALANAISAHGEAIEAINGTLTEHTSSLTALDASVAANAGDIAENAKAIAKNATAIGDDNSGLTKAVKANTAAIGDENSGLIKDIATLKAYNNTNDTAISNLDARISANEDAIGDNTKGLIKGVADNTKAIGENASAIDTNAKAIAANAEAIGDNTKGLTKRVKDLETYKTTNESSISGLDERITANTNAIATNTAAIGDQNSGLIKAVADNTKAIGENASAIDANAKAIGDDNSGLTKRVKDLETYKTTNESAVNSLDNKVSSLESVIGDNNSGLVKQVATNTSNIATINQAIGTDSDTSGSIKGEINAIKDTINNSNSGLIKKISENTKAIQQNASDISGLDKKIDDTKSYIDTAMQTADAMSFRGVIATYAALPTDKVQKGDTYKVSAKIVNSTENTYQETDWFVGDLIIAKADQGKDDTTYTGGWYHISSGYEDDYNAYLTGSNNKIQLNGGAGEDKGSIIFASANSCLEVGLSSEATATGALSQNCTLSFDLVWGEF